jgi:rhodanese-related sulfurtransferase
MRELFSILAITAFAFAVLTGCEKAAAPKIEKAASSPAASTPRSDDPADNTQRITLAEAKKDFDAGNVVFVDTRAEVQYKSERIKGSINMPLEAFETRYKTIPADKKIIAYCSWPSEHTSASLVAELNKKGIGNAYALVGGTQAWKTAGYPMEGEKK